MKNKVKAIAVALVIAIISSAATIICYANYDEKDTGIKLTYIDSYNGTIDHQTLSTTVTAKIYGKSGVSSVKIKMELQKLSSGTYSTVETWEQTFAGSIGSMEESKITNPFSTYRLKATFTAYSGSASETKTLYIYEE